MSRRKSALRLLEQKQILKQENTIRIRGLLTCDTEDEMGTIRYQVARVLAIIVGILR